MSFDRALQKHFSTDREKKRYMKDHNIVHDGSMEREKKRDERNAAIVNEMRNKRGLKSKTVQELAGNARKVKGRTLYFT